MELDYAVDTNLEGAASICGRQREMDAVPFNLASFCKRNGSVQMVRCLPYTLLYSL
jgi:hypothetical protein